MENRICAAWFLNVMLNMREVFASAAADGKSSNDVKIRSLISGGRLREILVAL
jgi:hypothetical protein